MLVEEVKTIARQWVIEEASKVPHFYGAFFVGSINWMPDGGLFPLTSDVDVKIVTEDANPPSEIHRLHYQNVVLEYSYQSSDYFQAPETILGDYPLACHFAKPNILVDPSGRLTKIQAAVAAEYAHRNWVQKRCEHARDWLLTSLQWLNEANPFHEQVSTWLYPIATTAHVVLVADLKNPTVRRSLVESREVLSRYKQLSLHEAVLNILGSAQMTKEQVQALLAACTEAFDEAKAIVKTPFFGSPTISDIARPIAIDGSRELIENGYHREAVFWLLVIYSWCQKVFYNDAPEEIHRQSMLRYRRHLRDVGINSFTDLRERTEQIKGLLPQIWEISQQIITTNVEIMD